MRPFESIRVGPFDLKIDKLQGKDHIDFLGTYSSATMSISMRDRYASEQLHAETLLHEVLHAIYQVYDVKPKDNEERIVTSLSVGLSCVIRDNPELIKWLQDSLDRS